MTLLRWLAAALILGQAQEPVLQVRAVTRDGQTFVGTPSVASVTIESGLGTTEIKLKDLFKVAFEGDSASAISQDRSSLKGKLKLEALKLTGRVGEVTLKPGALKEFSIQYVMQGMLPGPFIGERDQFVLAVRTQDGNDLVGTTDLSTISIESTLGRFDVDIRHVSTFTKGVEPNQLALLDGSEIRGAARVPEFKVRSKFGEFAIKPEALVSLSFREVRPREPRPIPPQGPPGKPAPVPSGPSSAPAIPPAAKVPLQAVLSEFRVSKDGKKLYALNLSEGKLCRWSLPGLETDGDVQVTGVEKSIALGPSGTKIYAVGQKTVSILSVEPLALQKSFSVEVALEDACAVDDDTLLATGQEVVTISISKTAVTQKFLGGGSSRITLSPAGDRAYVGEGLYLIRRNPGGRANIESVRSQWSSSGTAAAMSFSSDGRYSCSGMDGRVYRLGRCWAAFKVPHVQVEMHLAAAFSPDGLKFYVFTAEGFLKVYDTTDFTLQASHRIGVRACQALMAPDGKSVTLAAASEAEPSARRGHNQGLNSGALVDLYRFEIPK